MKGLKQGIRWCIRAGVLTTLLLTANGTEAAALSCGKWSLIHSPNPGGSAALAGVTALSANNVWAVGADGNTLTMQWNGSSWKVVQSRGPHGGALNSVAAISAGDMWAVGDAPNSGSVEQILTEHWNGSSWKVVQSPSPGSEGNALTSVAAVAANDVWAVGVDVNNGAQQTLIEHWNGTSWKIVSSPNPGMFDYLYGVAAIAANDVWAVGNDFNSFQNDQTLIEHWDGTNWKIVTSPNPGPKGDNLSGVAAVSANDIWTVGGSLNSQSTYQTLTMHWDGSGWKAVQSPNLGASINLFTSVAVVSTNSIWAVGAYYNSQGVQRTLTEHWDGSSWKVVHSPNHKATINNALTSTASIPGTGNVWTVGSTFFGEGSSRTITEFYC